ncbi:MAG: zinc-ribbon domain containing protein [Byssovorax sp.]
MEQHRDEHLTCADCSAPFLFSASEAAIFAERGLASPKRCKDCRRARKERNQAQGQGGGFGRPAQGHGGPRDFGGGGRDFGGGGRDFNRGGGRDFNQGGGRDFNHGGPRDFGGGGRDFGGGGRDFGGGDRGYGRPDGGYAPRFDGGGRPPPRYTGDVNEYRSPMQDNGYGSSQGSWGGDAGYAPRRAPGGGGPRPGPRMHGGPPSWGGDGQYRSPSPPRRAEGMPQDRSAAPRRRPQAEMFSITCNQCGVQAEVPFRPAEGRDVFCQACYRARKPS